MTKQWEQEQRRLLEYLTRLRHRITEADWRDLYPRVVEVQNEARERRNAEARSAREFREAPFGSCEDQERKQLSLRLVDIGYKALAKQYHPDLGGSLDIMMRLNRVRDRLRQSA